jgi:aerobic carbon-monoxide dehydrogenase medium subunit
MRGFEFVQPASLAEAAAMLAADEGAARPFAGGTGLMLMMKTGVFSPTRLVSLRNTEPALREIAATADGGATIGALASLTEIEHSQLLRGLAPVIARTMKTLANVRVRNVARIGGTLAHGDPHMDMPPTLAALRASVVTSGAGGRAIAVEDLYAGYYETILQPGELIARVAIPPQTGWRTIYLKCTTRSADDWPALGVAVSLRLDGGTIADSRVLISAATEKLARVAAAEAVLNGAPATVETFTRAGEATAANVETVEDARGSAAYKSELVRVYVRRALQQAMEGQV